MAPTDPLSMIPLDFEARSRTKERMYVATQTICWGALLVFFWAATQYFGSEQVKHAAPLTAIILTTSGLLITHYSRRLIHRWGWQKLNGRGLIPRVVGMGALQGILWSVFMYCVQRWVCVLPMPKVNPLVLIAANSFNTSLLMIGWLGFYFLYHVFDRFNRIEIERLQAVATVKQAELRALKSQLNPHFIFNALNSLRALIDEDPRRAREAVTQLANLLRYSLQSVQRETVPFEEELRVVNDYLALEQVRHEERLKLSLDVPKEALQWPVPPLLLQTLVENAVKYGISPRPEGGEIVISARCQGAVMTLCVTNPGQLAPAGANGSTGVGLANASHRLQLLFGERSSLNVRADGPNRVVAEAVIPLNPARN